MDRGLTIIERCASRSTVKSCGSCRRCHGTCQPVNSVSVLLLATSGRRGRSGATSARQRRAALQVDTSPASMGCECLRLLAMCTRCTPATRICCIWVLGTARPITSCCTRPLSALPRHRPTGQQRKRSVAVDFRSPQTLWSHQRRPAGHHASGGYLPRLDALHVPATAGGAHQVHASMASCAPLPHSGSSFDWRLRAWPSQDISWRSRGSHRVVRTKHQALRFQILLPIASGHRRGPTSPHRVTSG